jgi:hypothetical protein
MPTVARLGRWSHRAKPWPVPWSAIRSAAHAPINEVKALSCFRRRD